NRRKHLCKHLKKYKKKNNLLQYLKISQVKQIQMPLVQMEIVPYLIKTKNNLDIPQALKKLTIFPKGFIILFVLFALSNSLFVFNHVYSHSHTVYLHSISFIRTQQQFICTRFRLFALSNSLFVLNTVYSHSHTVYLHSITFIRTHTRFICTHTRFI